MTVLADKWQGKPSTLPTKPSCIRMADLVHRSGLTQPGELRGLQGAARAFKEAVYRLDPKSGKLDLVTDALYKPNGLCFSPDYKKLYIADTGRPTIPRRPRTFRCSMWWTAAACQRASHHLEELAGIGRGLWPTAFVPTSTVISGRRRWVGEGYDRCSHLRSQRRAHGMILLPGDLRQPVFRRTAPQTGCSWPPANPSTPFTSRTQGAHIT